VKKRWRTNYQGKSGKREKKSKKKQHTRSTLNRRKKPLGFKKKRRKSMDLQEKWLRKLKKTRA